MPRFTKDDQVIETSNAVEGARLRAQGFVESKARTAGVRERDAEHGTATSDAGDAAGEEPDSKPTRSSRSTRRK